MEKVTLMFHFRTQSSPVPKGHVIAARITAENPDEVIHFRFLFTAVTFVQQTCKCTCNCDKILKNGRS